MRILHLTLMKKWFDLIRTGVKKEEFRELKPYWESRLLKGQGGEGREFDIVRFYHGYEKDRPSCDVEFKGISITTKDLYTPKNGEVLWPETIVIRLGKVLHVSNINSLG